MYLRPCQVSVVRATPDRSWLSLHALPKAIRLGLCGQCPDRTGPGRDPFGITKRGPRLHAERGGAVDCALPDHVLFIRAGTLDHPETMPPDVHIHTSSKQPHVTLSEHTPRFDEFYDPKSVWSPESIKRYSDMTKAQARG